MTDDYGQDILARTETLEGSWEYAGDTYSLEVEDVEYGTFALLMDYAQIAVQAAEGNVEADAADGLDPLPWEDAYETDDFITLVLKEKLLKPEVDPQTTANTKLQALLRGMFETWQQAGDVEMAREEMPIDEGNR